MYLVFYGFKKIALNTTKGHTMDIGQ